MSRLKIPFIPSSTNGDVQVMAIEGPNGAGKTTLMERFAQDYKDVECTLCVPYIYQTAKDMKHFMLFESDTLCSAMYYLAGAVEMRAKHPSEIKKILYDRSLWSTFAAAYANNPTIIQPLLGCLNVIKDKVFFPEKIVVLSASYETCQSRSNKKTEGGEFDRDKKEEMSKKINFYNVLKESGYDVTFIETDNLSVEEVYSTFIKIAKNYWILKE